MALIYAMRFEKVRKSENFREIVRLPPFLRGFSHFRRGARSARSAAGQIENRGGRMAAEIDKVSNC